MPERSRRLETDEHGDPIFELSREKETEPVIELVTHRLTKVRKALRAVQEMSQQEQEAGLTPETFAVGAELAMAAVAQDEDVLARDDASWEEVRSAAGRLHALEEAFGTLQWAQMQNLETVSPLPERLAAGVRIELAQDAESAYRTLLTYVSQAEVNAPTLDLRRQFGRLAIDIRGRLADERTAREVAERKKIQQVDATVASYKLTLGKRAPADSRTAFDEASTKEVETRIERPRAEVITRKSKAIPEHTVEVFADDFAVLMNQASTPHEMQKVSDDLAEVLRSIDDELFAAEEAMETEIVFTRAKTSATEMKHLSELVRTARNEHWDRVSVSAEADTDLIRLEGAEDAEAVFSVLLDVAVGQLEHAPEDMKGELAGLVTELTNMVEYERAVRDMRRVTFDERWAAE